MDTILLVWIIAAVIGIYLFVKELITQYRHNTETITKNAETSWYDELHQAVARKYKDKT